MNTDLYEETVCISVLIQQEAPAEADPQEISQLCSVSHQRLAFRKLLPWEAETWLSSVGGRQQISKTKKPTAAC